MKLLIEIGNSKLKAAQLILNDDGTIDRLNYLGSYIVKDFCYRPNFSKIGNIDEILYANVGSQQNYHYVKALSQKLRVRYRKIASPEQAFGVTNSYDNPHKLGVDRWLALLAAYKDAKRRVVVIDIGTAMTVDLVDSSGLHLGGWISPGFRLMNLALTEHTALVRSGGHHGEDLVFGQHTKECVQNGCRAALAGTVLYAIHKANSYFEDGEAVSVYLTGGGVNHLPPETKDLGQYRPHLVLEGLALYVNQAD
ncbi:MAG: type III pantothenate kinase [Gammaproteobacteria bacterium]|nr:type III pantothenate kinase [Gammaproteobacteria bacterium]